jgi:hypothetical protein
MVGCVQSNRHIQVAVKLSVCIKYAVFSANCAYTGVKIFDTDNMCRLIDSPEFCHGIVLPLLKLACGRNLLAEFPRQDLLMRPISVFLPLSASVSMHIFLQA